MKEKNVGLWFLLPTIIFLALFVAFPLLYSLRLSFFSWSPVRPERGTQFVGFHNFTKLILKDRYFLHSFLTSLIFTSGVVTSQFFLGLFLAYALYTQGRPEKIFTTMFVIPTVMTPVVVALQWKFLLDAEYGFLNWFLGAVGLIDKPIGWLSKTPYALYSIMMVDVWHWTPLMYIILLAGLRALSKEPFEQAKIDGASSWQIFVYIAIPMLKPVVLIALLIRTITALLFFDEIYILTKGGPGTFTEVVSWRLYKMGFGFWKMGYAAAGSWLFLILTIGICNIFIYFMGKEGKGI